MFDWYDSGWYAGGGATCNDCANLNTASYRVIRGGSFYSTATYLRAAYRGDSTPTYHSNGIGFRCARTP